MKKRAICGGRQDTVGGDPWLVNLILLWEDWKVLRDRIQWKYVFSDTESSHLQEEYTIEIVEIDPSACSRVVSMDLRTRRLLPCHRNHKLNQ